MGHHFTLSLIVAYQSSQTTESPDRIATLELTCAQEAPLGCGIDRAHISHRLVNIQGHEATIITLGVTCNFTPVSLYVMEF